MGNTTTVTNISKQVIKVMYSMIAVDANVTAIPPGSSGELAIMPGGSLTIETNRLDLGQINTFQKKNLIKYVTY